MAQLATERGESPDVVSLAERIEAAQGPEIEEMTARLTEWDEDATPSDHGHMDMGGMEMNGMSQEEMMAELGGLSGTDFDRAFLEGMIAHHEGAVEMAEQQTTDGENAEATALAEQIITDQQAEIAAMRELLTGLA